MSRLAWLTLDDYASSTITLAITVPNSESWKAQLRGALVPLIYSENFEEFGALSPDEMADYWRDIILEFFEERPLIFPGMIVPYAGETPPVGWLLCDGSMVDNTDYPGLFAATNYSFGYDPGNSNLFRLPDLRGQTVVGVKTTDSSFNYLGKSGGVKDVTLTLSQMPSHYHQFNINGGAGSFGAIQTVGSGVNPVPTNTTTVGSSQSHTNLQPYLSLNYIIKT